jgi:hypothetical protein
MLFTQSHRTGSDAKKRFYAAVELVYTAVDFSAAVCFVVGSVMFLYEDWQTVGTWFFIVGSILFAFKPVIRMAREIRLAAMGDDTDLAKRAGADVED